VCRLQSKYALAPDAMVSIGFVVGEESDNLRELKCAKFTLVGEPLVRNYARLNADNSDKYPSDFALCAMLAYMHRDATVTALTVEMLEKTTNTKNEAKKGDKMPACSGSPRFDCLVPHADATSVFSDGGARALRKYQGARACVLPSSFRGSSTKRTATTSRCGRAVSR
jgi:hypothetical protein